MASKIQSYNFYVAIKPYKIEGHEDEFNELSVYVSYDNRQKHFYVSLHAGWGNGSMHGCILYGGQGWLTDTQWVAVKDAPKNSQKTINEMGAALEQAKELIGCLFDNRDYDKLEHAVKMIALHGYTEDFRRTAEEYMNQNKPETSNLKHETNEKEDKTMKPNENESANVQNAQVNNIKTSADVAEVQDIMPVVTPSAKSGLNVNENESKPAAPAKVKVKTNLKPVNVKPETKPTGVLPTLTLAVYTTKRGEQAPRIDGFGGEEDPRWKKHYDEKIRLNEARSKAKKKNEKIRLQMKGKSAAEKEALLKKIVYVGSDPFGASYFTDHTTGEKTYYFCMGAKYMDVAQQLVDAYNSGDEQAIAQAEQAVIDCKSGIVAEIEASRNSNGNEPETCDLKPETKVYTAAEVADLIQRIAKSDPKALAEYDALTKKAA